VAYGLSEHGDGASGIAWNADFQTRCSQSPWTPTLLVSGSSHESRTTFSSRFQKEQHVNYLTSKVRRFLESEDGPTAVEYAVMLGLIIVALITVIGNLTTSVSGTFSTVSSSLSS
jgi:pilus assembly protein Flp/PilA